MEAAGVGAAALQVMEAEHGQDKAVFKLPLVPKGRVKKRTLSQVVLDEDSYTQELANIIERDYFPDLAEIRERTQAVQPVTPGVEASPATFETPARSSDEPKDKFWDKVDKKGVQKLTLDQFLMKHTSEDNQSFKEILENTEMKRRQKYEWLYGAEESHALEAQKQLALPSIEQQANGLEKPLNVDGWNYKSQNYIMYIPDGVSLTEAEVVEMAANRQQVVTGNTRLHSRPFDELASRAQIVQMAHAQACGQTGRIGVDGLTLAAPTPQVKGFSLVRTPSPAPGKGGETPVMTWGEVEGTPCRLDTPSFRMANTPRREQIAHALADRAGQRHRDRKLKAIEAARSHLAPSPGRTPLLSPAAQRLAQGAKKGKDGDAALRASYTPRRTPSTSSITTPSPSLIRTPRTPLITKRVAVTTPKGIPSDDLLQLPKRNRAETFFR